MKQIRVLIVEDSEDDELLLLLKLKRGGYEVQSERVDTASQMKTALLEKEWDIVIADYEMPGFSGMDAYQILVSTGLDIPFIIVSGSIGEETAVQAMLAGVNDYIMKDSIARLIPAIERELRSAAARREQRETQKALYEGAERYRSLFENANDMIYTIDLQGNFTSVNKRGETLLGFRREEILQSNLDDYLNAEEVRRTHEMREKKLKGIIGETRYELDFHTISGDIRHVEISSRVNYRNDTPYEILGIARDITEQKKLLTDLSESEKRLNLALSGAKMGVWEWDMLTNAVYWSDECYEVLGYEKFGGVLESFTQIVYPEDFDGMLKKVEYAIANRERFKNEYRIFKGDGSIIWVFDQGVAEYNDEGKPIRCIGTVRDVTAKKQLEQELLASEMRFRKLSENNVAGVTLGKADGTLLFVNDAFLSIIGYSREEFNQGLVNCYEVTAPEHHELDTNGFIEARRFGHSDQIEKEYIRKDGTRVPVLLGIAFSELDGEEFFICTVLDYTNRKKAEKDLRESVEDFRALVEASSQIVWTIVDGQANEEFRDFWENLTGQKYEQAKFDGWLNVVHPDDRETAEQTWQHAFTTRTPFASVYRILNKAGEYRSFAVRGVPILEENREFRKWVGTFTDITERRAVEEELRKSEARLQLSQEAGRVGTWEWIYQTNELIWSDLVWEFHGLTPNEIPLNFENWQKFLHPDDLKYIFNSLSALQTSREDVDVEFRVITKNNEVRWISSKGKVIRDEKGGIERLIGINIDITERKKVEKALRQSEARFELASESAGVGTAEWNLTTNKTFWSDEIWRQFGLEPGSIECNYDNYMSFVLPADREFVEKHFNDAIANGIPVDVEYRMKRISGEIFWVAAKGLVIYNKENKPERMVGVTIDITSRKRVEENLQASEEKLIQAQKLESIGRLAGGIAHDFNNMLTAINGYSDLTLRAMSEDNPFRSNIEEIKLAGERSAMLTHQLLAFSRQQILQPKVLEINELISETTTFLKRLIGEDINLVTRLEHPVGKIKIDPGQFTQVVMNLTVNSRDAMPNGGTITIETTEVYLDKNYIEKSVGVTSGKYVKLSFTDTGSGMSDETLKHIFEPFYTTKKVGKGTGLGLATVYGIISQSGGHLDVTSNLEQGTTFDIYLPVIDEERTVEQKLQTTGKSFRGKETILVVEDEDAVRKLTSTILTSYGYKVIEAKDGEDALRIIENPQNKFDLLLTDVVMPNMGGLELSKKVIQTYPNMPIIYASGYTDDFHIQSEIATAETHFVHKPFDSQSLAGVIRDILDKT